MAQQYKLPFTGQEIEEKLINTIPAPATASVGQTIVVKEVDENGKPTSWEAIDFTSPDWNQNDPTAPDYVKNRPFWIDDPVNTVLFDGTVINDDALEIELIVGQEYTVTLDGTEYILIALDDGDGSVIIGSESLWWGNDYVDTEPPFVLGVWGGGSWFYTLNEGEEHTLRVLADISEVHKIDAKCLPTLVGESTTGKVYKIDDTEVTAQYGAEIFNDYGNIASGMFSHAEGGETTASGNFSHAEGRYTTASGTNSHAEGNYTTASGSYSHAEGNDTTASSMFSHAEGTSTTASGVCSHAEGTDTTASGTNSHVEGNYTTASGTNSHAEGYGSTVSGNSSHAEGFYTFAQSNYQHVQGTCNIVDSNRVYAHIVGNGENEKKRSNAHTLDWSGNAWYAGDIYVGSISGTNKDEGSKKLATEEFVAEKAKATADDITFSSFFPSEKYENPSPGTIGSVMINGYPYHEIKQGTYLTMNIERAFGGLVYYRKKQDSGWSEDSIIISDCTASVVSPTRIEAFAYDIEAPIFILDTSGYAKLYLYDDGNGTYCSYVQIEPNFKSIEKYIVACTGLNRNYTTVPYKLKYDAEGNAHFKKPIYSGGARVATEEYVDASIGVISSSTKGSTKKFRITVDDSGTLSAVEITE